MPVGRKLRQATFSYNSSRLKIGKKGRQRENDSSHGKREKLPLSDRRARKTNEENNTEIFSTGCMSCIMTPRHRAGDIAHPRIFVKHEISKYRHNLWRLHFANVRLCKIHRKLFPLVSQSLEKCTVIERGGNASVFELRVIYENSTARINLQNLPYLFKSVITRCSNISSDPLF